MSEEKDTPTDATLGALCSLVGGALQAYALSQLWTWFPVRMFGLQTISFVGACGLILIAGLLHPGSLLRQQYYTQPLARGVGALVLPACLLRVGWIIQFWM